MKKLFSILPMLAFMLGLTAAVANQAPDLPEETRLQAFINGQWQDIPGQVMGEDYTCELPLTEQCTRVVDEGGNPRPGESVPGKYEPIAP